MMTTLEIDRIMHNHFIAWRGDKLDFGMTDQIRWWGIKTVLKWEGLDLTIEENGLHITLNIILNES